MIVPVNNNYHLEYSKKVKDLLISNDIRVELDSRDEKLSYKLRESQMKKIPYTLILGDNELEQNSVSYRKHGETNTTSLKLDEFVDYINKEIKNYK